MIQINLLPKEYRKKSRFLSFQKGTLYALAAAGAVVVLMIFATGYQTWKLQSVNSRIREAQARTEKLKKDIQLVDALSEVKEKLLRRMTAIENLDKYRTVWIRIIEDLSSRIPQYLWLSAFKEEPQATASANVNTPPGQPPTATPASPDTTRRAELNYGPRKATVEGQCYSINSLAAFLINLSRSNYFKNVELKYVRSAQQDKYKFFSFQLGCDLIYYIEPPSFAKAEQASPGAGISEPSLEQVTPLEPQEAQPSEPGQNQPQPGQSNLNQADQTLVQGSTGIAGEKQKTRP